MFNYIYFHNTNPLICVNNAINLGVIFGQICGLIPPITIAKVKPIVSFEDLETVLEAFISFRLD